jgi:hypothetical protein
MDGVAATTGADSASATVVAATAPSDASQSGTKPPSTATHTATYTYPTTISSISPEWELQNAADNTSSTISAGSRSRVNANRGFMYAMVAMLLTAVGGTVVYWRLNATRHDKPRITDASGSGSHTLNSSFDSLTTDSAKYQPTPPPPQHQLAAAASSAWGAVEDQVVTPAGLPAESTVHILPRNESSGYYMGGLNIAALVNGQISEPRSSSQESKSSTGVKRSFAHRGTPHQHGDDYGAVQAALESANVTGFPRKAGNTITIPGAILSRSSSDATGISVATGQHTPTPTNIGSAAHLSTTSAAANSSLGGMRTADVDELLIAPAPRLAASSNSGINKFTSQC